MLLRSDPDVSQGISQSRRTRQRLRFFQQSQHCVFAFLSIEELQRFFEVSLRFVIVFQSLVRYSPIRIGKSETRVFINRLGKGIYRLLKPEVQKVASTESVIHLGSGRAWRRLNSPFKILEGLSVLIQRLIGLGPREQVFGFMRLFRQDRIKIGNRLIELLQCGVRSPRNS